MPIRPYRPADAGPLAQIYRRAILQGAAAFYTEAERRAWAQPAPDEADWAARLGDHITVVADRDGALQGFMTMGRDGHLDLAFVVPEAMGTGVAAALHDRLLYEAARLRLPRLTTEASHLARRFFLKQGWRELAQQSVPRNGERLTNFRMEKPLAVRPGV